jgi:hypothetical protein
MMAQRYTGRQRSYGSLKADIEDFVKESDARLLAVTRASIQDVVLNMQEPVAKGGRMRVDTGFLRNSGSAAIGAMPSGESERPSDAVKGQYNWSEDRLPIVLSKLEIGDTFYWGWTANYARYRELYDGFMEAALQQWGRIVAFNTDTLRKRLKK